jgi:hypothetical protein
MAGTETIDALGPLRERYDAQHYNLRKFYYECSNLKFLTSLINVPKLPQVSAATTSLSPCTDDTNIQQPPNLLDAGDADAPDLPRRPTTKEPSPPPAPSPRPDLEEQKRALQEYEDKQNALVAERDAERRRMEALRAQQARDFEKQQRLQAERERLAAEDLQRQQAMQFGQQNQSRLAELEREILAMRGQWERDQMMLERYDAVCPFSFPSRNRSDTKLSCSVSKHSRESCRTSVRVSNNNSRPRTNSSASCKTK